MAVILVTGAGGGSGMCAIRMLRETTGHTIIGCDADKHAQGLYLAHRGYVVPLARDPKFMTEMQAIVEAERVEIVFPNVDEELEIWAEHRKKLNCHIIVSEPQTIRICLDKFALLEMVKDTVPCPRTLLGHEANAVEFPCFIKPRTSRGSRDTFVVEDDEEFELLMRLAEKRGFQLDRLLVQEYLPGQEYTVDTLCDFTGNVVVAVPRKRIKTAGGISHVGETVRRRDIIGYVQLIAEKMHFRGPINIQFKEDRAGIPKLTEVNPRLSGGMAITLKSGINLPKLTLMLLDGAQIPVEQLNWQERVVFRYLAEI